MATTLFELQAKLGLNIGDFTSGLSDAKEAANEFGLASSVALGNMMADAMTNAISRAAEFAADMVRSVFSHYADYEQLAGGVQTIFGGSADTVLANANDAYQTAGMSANQYLSSVMGYSSRLLQGLGGDTALTAYYADMAVKDMADNANKFGTSLSFVENAYQGFSRNNFTMLDNLKLGYGGTQAEMVRLLNDAGVMAGLLKDETGAARAVTLDDLTAGSIPLHKIFEAIHAIQGRMGVTGTTAAEATATLTGSKNAAAAAWDNLLAGLGDPNADIPALYRAFLDAGGNAVENYVSAGKTVVGNIGELLFANNKSADRFREIMLQNEDPKVRAWQAEMAQQGMQDATELLYEYLLAGMSKESASDKAAMEKFGAAGAENLLSRIAGGGDSALIMSAILQGGDIFRNKSFMEYFKAGGGTPEILEQIVSTYSKNQQEYDRHNEILHQLMEKLSSENMSVTVVIDGEEVAAIVEKKVTDKVQNQHVATGS